MGKAKDITGQRFGRLTAIKSTNKRHGRNIIWECACSCGKTTYASTGNLGSGHTTSCGCYRKEIVAATATKRQPRMLAVNFVEGTNAGIIRKKTSNINNKTGIRGVYLDTHFQKYKAEIQFKNKKYFLGYYKKIDEASKARKQAEEMLFEPFLEWYNENFKSGKAMNLQVVS